MINKIIKWFNKNEEDAGLVLPKNEIASFTLKYQNIIIGYLQCSNGEWIFKYSDEFKKKSNLFNPITGFSDYNKVYHSKNLWPFFRVRIPGLKQPAIQETLKKEHLDKENEVALLKRFGQRTISNPYELVLEN